MIQKIKLTDFRNFKSKILEFSPKITVIVGSNAVGKTNILESLFLLSTGKSFKAKAEVEMLRYDAEIARISAVISNMSHVISSEQPKTHNIKHNTNLDVLITRGDNGWPRKKLMVNGVGKRLVDFAGNFKVVLFGPWDMDLVTESPSIRRKFLDNVLSQVDREYRRSILSYEKGLRQRNKLLFRIREEGASRSQLLFWNQLLIKNGNYITEKRQEFIAFVNNKSKLNTNTTNNPMSTNYQLEYDRSVISEGRLDQYASEEVAAATTLVGPHRDDVIFKIQNPNDKFQKERDLAAYGSRGEQRMGVLWLKMAELDYIEAAVLRLDESRSGFARPTLLLDDIFSELDHEHRGIVKDLAKKQQTIITTAEEHFLEDFKKENIIRL